MLWRFRRGTKSHVARGFETKLTVNQIYQIEISRFELSNLITVSTAA